MGDPLARRLRSSKLEHRVILAKTTQKASGESSERICHSEPNIPFVLIRVLLPAAGVAMSPPRAS